MQCEKCNQEIKSNVFQIKSWRTGNVLFESSTATSLKECVEQAKEIFHKLRINGLQSLYDNKFFMTYSMFKEIEKEFCGFL